MTANKGTVLTVGEGANLNMVRVAPIDNIDAVSTFYKIPKYLQDEDIKKVTRLPSYPSQMGRA